jgi:hypothetical protein
MLRFKKRRTRGLSCLLGWTVWRRASIVQLNVLVSDLRLDGFAMFRVDLLVLSSSRIIRRCEFLDLTDDLSIEMKRVSSCYL